MTLTSQPRSDVRTHLSDFVKVDGECAKLWAGLISGNEMDIQAGI